MKIAAYCRVSTDKADQINSLEAQKEFFSEYTQRTGDVLVKLYADEGISGTKIKNRKEFLRMMSDAEKGMFDMVVVKDISRFARNTVDLLQNVRKLKALGIETQFLTANMTSMGNSEFVLTIFGALAQEESANTSKRVKFGKKLNAEKGRVPNIVYGYDKTIGDYFNLCLLYTSSEQKGFRMVNIFQDSVDAFGLSFYPDCGSEFYYVDPSDREYYIALDDYFGYLKLTRINELQKLAQDLGAKHFRVTYKEEKTAFSEKKTKANVKAIGMVGVEHDYNAKKYSTVEVAAEMTFPGHVPVNPMVKYLKHDPSVKTLISMRMNETAPLLHQKFMLKLSNSSGIKESEAIKIDAVLKGMKCAGNATVVSEVQNESRRYLEYEIDF